MISSYRFPLDDALRDSTGLRQLPCRFFLRYLTWNAVYGLDKWYFSKVVGDGSYDAVLTLHVSASFRSGLVCPNPIWSMYRHPPTWLALHSTQTGCAGTKVELINYAQFRLQAKGLICQRCGDICCLGNKSESSCLELFWSAFWQNFLSANLIKIECDQLLCESNWFSSEFKFVGPLNKCNWIGVSGHGLFYPSYYIPPMRIQIQIESSPRATSMNISDQDTVTCLSQTVHPTTTTETSYLFSPYELRLTKQLYNLGQLFCAHPYVVNWSENMMSHWIP